MLIVQPRKVEPISVTEPGAIQNKVLRTFAPGLANINLYAVNLLLTGISGIAFGIGITRRAVSRSNPLLL